MAAASASNAARKKARDHAAALYDAQDEQRRLAESARRKRVLDFTDRGLDARDLR